MDAKFKLISQRRLLEILLPSLYCRQLLITSVSHTMLILKSVMSINLANNEQERQTQDNKLIDYFVY